MSFWVLLGLVIAAGAVGGLIGSCVNGNPASVFANWQGLIINMLIGAVAASLSWLLYGSASQTQIGATTEITMTASTLGGAVLVGMVGSAWLTKTIGQKLFQQAAAAAAIAEPSLDLAARMLTESPADALKSAKDMNKPLQPPDGVSPRAAA